MNTLKSGIVRGMEETGKQSEKEGKREKKRENSRKKKEKEGKLTEGNIQGSFSFASSTEYIINNIEYQSNYHLAIIVRA